MKLPNGNDDFFKKKMLKAFKLYIYFFHLVLYAMKEDSEKVPTLLTDYILKGKHKKPGLNC